MSIHEAKEVLTQSFPYSQEFLLKKIGKIEKIIILKTSWYQDIIEGLEQSAMGFLSQMDVAPEKVEIFDVPGSLEMPLAMKTCLSEDEPDLLILLGCVIKGETPHFDILCQNAFSKILDLQLKYKAPTGVGILTVNNKEQALARLDKGAEAAQAALGMYLLKESLKNRKKNS